jgi:sn-glycerol 3-phosphate transport system permease protein
MRIARFAPLPLVAVALLCGFALVWSTPLLWMLVASARDIPYGSTAAASLVPDLKPTREHFADAFATG